MKIKKGDNVIIIAGKDKGKKGKVLKSLPQIQKVIVDGLNVVKRHKKPRQQGKKGEIVDVFSPIHVSNVSLSKVESKSKTTKKDK
ncbi:MAG TPA: 50S ribosomal protein L24 [Candidatus Paceibacterota bacterium]|nr:50S ribosomal protein L24 [Candidatus Paceibacterota bacterium]HMP19188.1 50S ribosomal protein L24 [Candidatus Paceibacterota bacterium]HMP85281.1 50S ribosomal protein L24 [Candidatus Paceibacterota bacterium]